MQPELNYSTGIMVKTVNQLIFASDLFLRFRGHENNVKINRREKVYLVTFHKIFNWPRAGKREMK